LYFEGSSARRSLGSYAIGETPYISTFPWKDFLMGRIKKIQNHKEERHRSGKLKKTRWKEWRKEKEEIFTFMEVLILICSALVGNTKGYHPCATFPQENPHIWEPPVEV
jgi:hypothetical protein